jgi:Tol biopolymer transport system component
VPNRRKMLSAMVVLLAVGIVACTMDIGGEGSSKPTVEILSPASGSRVALGQELEVQYRATDSIAVVRVELEVERQIVDLQNSPTAEGQPSLSGILRWTPTTAGTHTLLVYAYNREGVSSDGVGVEIIVGEGGAPEATATQVGEVPTGPMATVVLSDDFSDPSSGWAVSSEETYRLGYEGGEYFIEHTHRNDASRWQTYPDQTFSDFVAEVEARFEAEDEFVGAALIWRWQDNDNFYRFRVRNTGEYDLVKRVGGEWQTLISATSSPHINSGIATNKLGVTAAGDLIQIYVNDQHLADFTDSSFARGRIGFYASVYTASPISTRVFFDNLRVWASGEEVPEAVPSPPAAMPTLAYSDDFNDPESGWAVGSGEGYAHGYEGGEYFVEHIGQTNRARWVTYPDRTFSDFTAEVQVRFDTDVGEVVGGLVWRWQDNDNFYRVRVHNTGEYEVKKRLKGEWESLLDRADSPHIVGGAATNALKIVAVGDLIQIYVNDQHVADVSDDSFAEGRVGVYASVYTESPITARISFDNLRVYVSEPAEATPGSYPPPLGKIVFASNRDSPEAIYKEIYVMNVDGSGLKRLTNYEFDDAMPRWSPDGRQIAFVSWRDGNWEIYLMNSGGSAVTRLTDDPASDLGPRWSPDGQRIVFYSDRDGNQEIYLMAADGSGQVNVSNNPARDRVADWSPDGEWIAFSSDRGGDEDVYLMKQDGSEVINLTRNPAKDYAPSWSPDGQRIVFESDRRLEGNADIYVMDADGSGVVRLTDYPQSDSAAGWSPDGRYIHFGREVSGVQGRWQMYIMRADGSEQTDISQDPSATYRDRDWSAGR